MANTVTEYVMPKLAMAMNEGTVADWLVQDGDYVEQGAPLATIETEKVAYDVEAPVSGYFYSVVSAGETVECEVLLAHFCNEPQRPDSADTSAKSSTDLPADTLATNDAISKKDAVAPLVVASASDAASTSEPKRLKSSPLARKLAKQLNVQLDTLTGSGPGGRIVKRDVMAASEKKTHPSAQLATAAKQVSGDDILATLPISGLRKTIANRMVQSLQNTAQVSCHWESDITRLLAQRAELVEQEELLGTRVSVNAFLIKALVYAIRQVPIANANVIGNEIIIHRNINMGMAISIPGSTEYDSGLMVGVLHNVESMGLVAIDKGMRSLIARVRNGEAASDDLSGSTFTLSSTAGIGPPGLKTTPVLNQPNVALLGPSTPIERPMIRDGEVKACTMLPLSFTFDHQALDGEPAARFMAALNNALEKPSLLLT